MSYQLQSPNVTPFIPPLPSPEGASPNHAPVLPSPNGAAPPPWVTNPQTPAHYPIYPSTPYSGGNPFIPPGSYFPPPTTLPPTAPNPNSGFSGDYTGYPQFTSAPQPAWPLPPPAGYPGTPFHGPQSAPPQGNWTQHPRTPYVPFQAPLSAGAYPPPMFQGMPGVPQGWGMPVGPGFPPGGFPTPGPGVIPHPHTPAAPVNDTLHYAARDGDVPIGKFAVGDHYGPVLEPFLVRVVDANVKINPLLAPPRDVDESVFLKWNMLFVSAYCQRSNDPPHVSWSKGRKEPATFPRVTHLRVVSSAFPWMISLEARNKNTGITCGEVIDGIDEYLHKLIKGEEYNALPRAKQKKITDAYKHNRAPAHGVPGGALGDGVRRLDWLCQDTMFGGITQNNSLVTSICGDVLPCTFELKCIHRYPLNEREIQEQAERDRAVARERQRSRQSRVPTVEPASDDDDGD